MKHPKLRRLTERASTSIDKLFVVIKIMQTSHDATAVIERGLKVELTLRYDVRSTVAPSPRAPLLIALHGYGGSKRQMMREAARIAPDDFVVACPQGLHQHLREPRDRSDPRAPLRFGFGWLTNYRAEESVRLHHEMLSRIADELAIEKLIDPRRIFLLGFSQSCALNYRFAFTHADVLRGVIGICGGLPGDWETSAAYQPTAAGVFHLAGAGDDIYPPARTDDYARQLRSRAADVEYKSYDAAHEINDAMRSDVCAWLARRAT